jgi:hypothetical protein
MIVECKSFLLENAADWGMPGDGEWTFFFHNNFHAHHSNVNLLWFHNGSRYPHVVTKVFREPQVPTREFENLQRAYGCSPQWVPKPLHCGSRGRFWTLWMRGVRGVRPYKCSPASLRSMTEAVASMHQSILAGNLTPIGERHTRLVSEPIEAVARYGTSASIERGCRELASIASAEWLDRLPRIPQHGDLFVDNLLSEGRAWRVVDWESFGSIDLPFYDLITLLLSLLGVGIETPDQWAPALTAQMPGLMEQYAGRLNLPMDVVPLLLPLSLANWFHLHLSDGRAEFAARMYKQLEHYFEHPDAWNRLIAT